MSVKISTFLWSLVALGTCFVASVHTMNLVQPYYAFMKPRYRPDTAFQWGVYAEKGFHFKGYGHDGCSSDPLGIWQHKQNALAMLQGFDSTSPQGTLLSMLQDDQPACSLLCFKGALKHDFSVGFSGRYYMSHDFSIGAYLPVYKVSLDCPAWSAETTTGCERTQQLIAVDVKIPQSWKAFTSTGDLVMFASVQQELNRVVDLLLVVHHAPQSR